MIVSEEDAALTSIGSRECDESLHLARGPNFEFHARSIGPYIGDGRSRSGEIRERSRTRMLESSDRPLRASRLGRWRQQIEEVDVLGLSGEEPWVWLRCEYAASIQIEVDGVLSWCGGDVERFRAGLPCEGHRSLE